ncbi:MAG: tRNA (adenosine(37)-N6)-threonylcarbamoyltransferase complex ATPase subunit type 1 TsaE [Saccharospirillum sp.]
MATNGTLWLFDQLGETDSVFRVALEAAQMAAFGQALARVLQDEAGAVVYLNGTLGMGKTTLSQAVIQGCGWSGRVKSPTYTLLEPYECERLLLVHIDLYRLADPQELEYLGLRDYLEPNTAWLIEWPERGLGVLPGADIQVHFEEAGAGRALSIEPVSEKGERLNQALATRWEAES